MKTSSAKAKGRRLCQVVREALFSWAPDLEPGDIQVTPSGVPGPDLYLSPAAKKIYDYDIECKMHESISIWACLKQLRKRHETSEAFARAEGKDYPTIPVLAFSRNREKHVYVCLTLDDFLKLTR